MNLYQLHSNPQSLYGYNEAPYRVPRIAYDIAIQQYYKTGQRTPKLESVIAQDPNVWKEYTNNLAMTAYRFAFPKYRTTRQRDSELEQAIAQDPAWAYRYARDVIEDRFPEAESVIAKNPAMATLYATNVIKKRWPEAEAVIKQDPNCWARYESRFKIK